jgi:hypothetical protein
MPTGEWIRRGLARFVGMVLIGWFALTLNLFDFLTYTEEVTLDIFNIVYGSELPNEYDEELSVVLIDDKYVINHSQWPLPFHEHAKILGKILKHEPKAVFIDLLFTQDRDSRGIFPLLLVLNEYKAKGVNVYLTSAESRAGIHPQLARLVTPVTTRLDRTEASEHDYRLKRFSSMMDDLTPAMALTQEYCESPPSGVERYVLWFEACQRLRPLGIQMASTPASAAGDPIGPSPLIQEAAGPATLDPMLMLWGTKHAEANINSFRCNKEVGTSAFEQGQRVVLDSLFGSLEDIPRERCPRFPTLLLDNLLGGFSDDQLSPYIHEKVVIYGPEVEGASLWTTPPTHEAMSVTYTHATALENLLLFGTDYFTRDRLLFGYSVKTLLERGLWLSLCLLVAFASVKGDRRVAVEGGSIVHRLLFDIAQFSVVVSVSVAVATVQATMLKMAPANVLGIIAIITGSVELRDSSYVRSLEGHIASFLRGRWLAKGLRHLRGPVVFAPNDSHGGISHDHQGD